MVGGFGGERINHLTIKLKIMRGREKNYKEEVYYQGGIKLKIVENLDEHIGYQEGNTLEVIDIDDEGYMITKEGYCLSEGEVEFHDHNSANEFYRNTNGIDFIRSLVNWSNYRDEHFNENKTPIQLINEFKDYINDIRDYDGNIL